MVETELTQCTCALVFLVSTCVCVCVCVFAATTVGSFFDKAVGAFQINGDKSLCGEVLRGTIRFRPIVLSFTVTMKEREKI